MKWIVKNKIEPKVGDIKFKTKFAWFPTKVHSKSLDADCIIWLEFYTEKYLFEEIKEYCYIIDIWYLPYNKWSKTEKIIP